MSSTPSLSGHVVQFEHPEWIPLTFVLDEHHCEWFMWMHEIRLADGTAVHAYKHVITRRYLHLAADGSAYSFLGDHGYAPVSLRLALQRLVPPYVEELLDGHYALELLAVADRLD